MRLAILLSHPVQYYSPWFRVLAQLEGLTLRVFYLWDSGVIETRDRGFGTSFAWDIPLLEGYNSEFVPNVSKDPGTHHFAGLDNPGVIERISRWKPEAVLLFGYAWKTQLLVLFSRKLRHVPKLYRGDSHALCSSHGMRAAIARIGKRRILKQFDHFCPVGKASEDYLRRFGVPDARITIVPHCVDNDRFRSQAVNGGKTADDKKTEWGIDSERPVILFVGKWETKKRPFDLLKAFLSARFSLEAGDPVLVFVGDGEWRDRLHEQAGDRVDRDVFFFPFQNQSAMPGVYAAGDVLVLPSLGAGETWGLVVNEAMNLGKPVIVSSHVGCGPDLVMPGATGWRFEAGSVGALRECLEVAMKDRDKLREMGERARERLDRFSYDIAAEKLQKALEAVGSSGKV